MSACGFSLAARYFSNEAENIAYQENRRIETGEHTDDKRQYESLGGGATQEEQREQQDQDRDNGIDRSAQGLVDTGIYQSRQISFRTEALILTDAVENNDGIIDGLTDYRQDSRDELAVDLNPENSKNTDQNQYIVGQGSDSGYSVIEAETNGDV